MGKTIKFLIIYILIAGGTAYIFHGLPSSYLPEEDQGMLFTIFMLPPGSTQNQTIGVIRKAQNFFLEEQKESVESFFGIAGFSFAGRGQNVGIAFIKLKDWDKRNKPDMQLKFIVGKAMEVFSQYREALIFAFAPPACVELGYANGFDLQLQDRSGMGHDKLMGARNMLLGMAFQSPDLMAVRPNGLDDTPELEVNINWKKAGALGLSIAEVQDSFSSAVGSSYVNDFIDRGRIKKVYLQGDAVFRMEPEDLKQWYIRNMAGKMVPFSAFATMNWVFGSPRLERYNGFPSVEIMGEAVPGKTSGQAMKNMENLVSLLPYGFGYEWTGLSYQEKIAGAQAPFYMVYLCL